MVMFNYEYITGQLLEVYDLKVKPELQENKDEKHTLCNEIFLGHC